MTWYLSIMPLTPLVDGQLDVPGRATVFFTLMIEKANSDTLLEEIVKKLEDGGVGTRAVNIFWSSAAEIPTGAGPYLALTEETGQPGLYRQNTPGVKYERPSIRVTAIAATYAAARSMARAALNLLSAVRNVELTT